jgi:CHAT domain-containing protein
MVPNARTFDSSEWSCARTLSDDRTERSQSSPFNFQRLRTALPKGAAFVYYAALTDKLLIWCITRDAVKFVEQPIAQERLAVIIDLLSEELWTASNSTSTRFSTDVFDLVLRPIESTLSGIEKLVVVPAGSLQLVPFGALYDSRKRSFLIETSSVLLAPSAFAFEHASRQLSQTSFERAKSVFVVANPERQAEVGEALPSLYEADREATEIVALYSSRQLLIGATATKTAFLEAVGSADVVHFGGHAVILRRHRWARRSTPVAVPEVTWTCFLEDYARSSNGRARTRRRMVDSLSFFQALIQVPTIVTRQRGIIRRSVFQSTNSRKSTPSRRQWRSNTGRTVPVV